LISVGTTEIPMKNWKQWLRKIWGGGVGINKVIMVYVEMVNAESEKIGEDCARYAKTS